MTTAQWGSIRTHRTAIRSAAGTKATASAFTSPLGRDAPGASPGDTFFGASTPDWRGHFGDAYGWITGLFWNLRENSTLVYAINGMPETDRPPGARSAMSAARKAAIDADACLAATELSTCTPKQSAFITRGRNTAP